MNIMLVCVGGMSTGILMKKMEKWGVENNREIVVEAYSVATYKEHLEEHQVILLGPQVSYKFEEVKGENTIPVAIIEPMDYALGNVEKILGRVVTLIEGDSL